MSPSLDLGQRADVVEDPGVVAVQPALGDALLLVLGLGGPVAGDGPDALCARGGRGNTASVSHITLCGHMTSMQVHVARQGLPAHPHCRCACR